MRTILKCTVFVVLFGMAGAEAQKAAPRFFRARGGRALPNGSRLMFSTNPVRVTAKS